MTAPGDALDGLWDKDGNFLGHQPCLCGDNHRTTGERAWCSPCQEWCYPDDGCRGCKPDVDDLMEQVAAQAERIAALEAQLAAVGPVVAAGQAVVERWNESNWIQDDTRDYSAPFADTLAALASAVREMGERQ